MPPSKWPSLLIALITIPYFAVVLVSAWLSYISRQLPPDSNPPSEPASEPASGLRSSIATVLAWVPPDPEVCLVTTFCTCGCDQITVSVVAPWANGIIMTPANIPASVLTGLLDQAAASVMDAVPPFRITGPVFKGNHGREG